MQPPQRNRSAASAVTVISSAAAPGRTHHAIAEPVPWIQRTRGSAHVDNPRPGHSCCVVIVQAKARCRRSRECPDGSAVVCSPAANTRWADGREIGKLVSIPSTRHAAPRRIGGKFTGAPAMIASSGSCGLRWPPRPSRRRHLLSMVMGARRVKFSPVLGIPPPPDGVTARPVAWAADPADHRRRDHPFHRSTPPRLR